MDLAAAILEWIEQYKAADLPEPFQSQEHLSAPDRFDAIERALAQQDDYLRKQAERELPDYEVTAAGESDAGAGVNTFSAAGQLETYAGANGIGIAEQIAYPEPDLIDGIVCWFKATADWTNPSGSGEVPYVTGNPCSDMNGTSVSTGTTATIYLPRTAEQDPNVRADEIIGAMRTCDGEWVCVTDYLDDKIGTIKWWNGTVADIAPGWYLCDGANGTIDLSARFIMCIDEDGIADEKNLGDAGGIGGYRYHGMTENGHPDHNDHIHELTPPGCTFDVCLCSSGYDLVTAATYWTTAEKTTVQADMDLRHGGTDPGFNAWPGGLTPTAESHSCADTDNRPRYYVLRAIQRVN